MTVSPNSGAYCSALSVQAGEQLFGSASRVDVWFLLQYSAPWGKRAFDESAIPAQVQQHLNAAARSVHHARIQVIKHPSRPAEQLSFYVALSKEFSPALYEFQLSSYEELLSLDLDAIVSGDPRYDESLDDEPVFMVCTHGTHDRCCALHGMPVYTAMAQRDNAAVWQTSHLGGHRFAANVVCLPHGAYYGRVTPQDVQHLVAGYRERRVSIDHFRGRSCYDAQVQAADYFLRLRTQILEFAGLRLLGVRPASESEAWVDFLSTTDGTTHAVRVAKEVGAVQTITSCGAASVSSLDQYRFVEHVQHDAQQDAQELSDAARIPSASPPKA
jgi:hypothetical protein